MRSDIVEQAVALVRDLESRAPEEGIPCLVAGCDGRVHLIEYPVESDVLQRVGVERVLECDRCAQTMPGMVYWERTQLGDTPRLSARQLTFIKVELGILVAGMEQLSTIAADELDYMTDGLFREALSRLAEIKDAVYRHVFGIEERLSGLDWGEAHGSCWCGRPAVVRCEGGTYGGECPNHVCVDHGYCHECYR